MRTRGPPRAALPGGSRQAAGALLLEQLAERSDVNLRHLQRLGLGQLLVTLQVRDDAPEPVEGDVEAQHPLPLPCVGSESAPSLGPLQSALIRLKVQPVAGGAQSELHDGAGGVLVAAATSDAGRLPQLLCSAPLKQGVDVGVENHRGHGAGSSLPVHRDIGRKQAPARGHDCSPKFSKDEKGSVRRGKINFLHFQGPIYEGGSRGDALRVLGGRGEGRVLLNEQSRWRSINQVHQKRIRSI